MALQLEGQTALLFRLGERGTGAPMPKKLCGRVYLRCGEICDLQTWHSVCGRSDGGLGGIGYCEESELPRLYREMR